MGQHTGMPDEPRSNSRVLLGLAIVLVGVAMLAERNDAWGIHLNLRWWPFLLIFLGLARMMVPGDSRRRSRGLRGGFWLLAVGVWGLISQAELFGLDYSTSWPLLLVALGINIAWKSLEAPPGRRPQEH